MHKKEGGFGPKGSQYYKKPLCQPTLQQGLLFSAYVIVSVCLLHPYESKTFSICLQKKLCFVDWTLGATLLIYVVVSTCAFSSSVCMYVCRVFLVTAAICDGGGLMGVTLCEQHDCYMLWLHSWCRTHSKLLLQREIEMIQKCAAAAAAGEKFSWSKKVFLLLTCYSTNRHHTERYIWNERWSVSFMSTYNWTAKITTFLCGSTGI